MKLVLEFDDFSPKNTNFGLLEDLKEHYEDFKVTVFTVPWEIRFGDPTPITEAKFAPFVEAVKAAGDWLEVALHGLTHRMGVGIVPEFAQLGYDDAKKRILAGEKMLINRGINYTRVFKAPGWIISKPAKQAAEDLGFMVVEDGYYNWNLRDEMPKLPKNKVVIAHGHIQVDTTNNGLEQVMPKLLNLPKDVKFMWLSEHLEAEKVDSEKIIESLKAAEKVGKQ